MFNNIFGGKSWYQSLTGWGVAIFAGGSALATAVCAAELISPELCATILKGVQFVGVILGGLGIRKASTAPNTG